MTITLEIGHTYRTRDGKAEHTILRVREGTSPYGAIAEAIDNNWWAATGQVHAHHEGRNDLVEEVRPAASSPVRPRTVTEIVPGSYGNFNIKAVLRSPWEIDGRLTKDRLNAEELRALATTATQLADALDAIASENQS